MGPIDPDSVRGLLEALIAGFSILGGGMAFFSGFNAAQALAENQLPETVAHSVNEGVGKGFEVFAPISAATFILLAWS